MNGIYAFIITFCSVCLMITGLHLLCPSGSLEITVKYILGLVFIVCILTCIPSFKGISVKSYESASQTASGELDIKMSELAFKLALKNSGIQFSKITVCTDKSQDGGIIINKVIVHSSHSPEAIRQALGGEAAEYAIEVVYG